MIRGRCGRDDSPGKASNVDDLSRGQEPSPILVSQPHPSTITYTYVTDAVYPGGIPLNEVIKSVPVASEASSNPNESEVWTCDCGSGNGGTVACGVNDGDMCDCVSSFGNFYTSPAAGPQRLLLGALPERLPLVECASACLCGKECANRLTQQGIHLPLIVRPAPTGLGAFHSPDAGSILPRGTFICLYVGEYLSTDQAHERWAEKRPDNYILSLRLSSEVIHIDARDYSNVARFLNHSCEPNCVILVVRWGGGNSIPRLAIFTKREVQPGEELTYDYANASGGSTFGTDVQQDNPTDRTKCLCGASGCKGWMPFDETL